MADFGNFSSIMAYVSFVNVLFTYGMETAYFRFSSSGTDRKNLFQTTFTSLIVSSAILGTILVLFRVSISSFIGVGDHPEYIIWCVLIIAIDTLAAIPFARLRQEERPRKYAFTRVAGILVNIFVTLYLVAWCPGHVADDRLSPFAQWYSHNNNVGFMLLANLAASSVTFLLLYREWLGYRFEFDKELWKKIITYSAPMIIIGLGGMVNETMDRMMLPKLLPVGRAEAAIVNGIYTANYKIAIFITLFRTAFQMSAEPFFFNQAKEKNAPKTYARVMKWFVIILCFAFLFTALYMDLWKFYIDKAYYSGLGVVPILLGANVCLGIYYNLSVWYKITDNMRKGMYITLVGAAITLILNFAFIPRYGMFACAWATFAAYFSMMVISYFMGQKYFPVPYNVKKLLAYLTVMLLLFFTEQLVMHLTDKLFVRLAAATILMALFLRLVKMAEKKELVNMPFIGKMMKQ